MTKTMAKPVEQPEQNNGTPQPLAKISNTLRDGITAIEGIAKAYSLSALATAGNFERALITAEGIKALRRLMTDEVMENLMLLQGSRLGFKTDRDKPYKGWKEGTPLGYTVEVVREVLIEMILRGALPVGNEINIIAGNGYGTKEFYDRAIGELPGVTDVKHSPGMPVMIHAGGAAVDYVIECLFNGERVRVSRTKTADRDTRIPVRINEGMGPDAILGKAHRKATKALYDQLTNSRLTIPDGDVDSVKELTLPGATATDTLAGKLADRAKALGTSPPLAEGELSADELKKINETEAAGTLPGMGTAAE